MSRSNSSSCRVHGELLKLGIEIVGCVNEFWPTLLTNFGPPSVADGDPISPFALAVSPPFAGQRFG